MTKEELEKEAEDSFNCKKVLYKWETDKRSYIDGFKDGAELGYNKDNEWHYMKDGDLPKVETWVIGFYYGKDNWHKIFYRADGHWWGEGQLCQPPYAWKEIVLPKESE